MLSSQPVGTVPFHLHSFHFCFMHRQKILISVYGTTDSSARESSRMVVISRFHRNYRNITPPFASSYTSACFIITSSDSRTVKHMKLSNVELSCLSNRSKCTDCMLRQIFGWSLLESGRSWHNTRC